MSIKQNSDRELIHKFLNNTLSMDEKKAFALRQQNAQFSDLLAEIIVQQKGRTELKHKLKAIGQQKHKTIRIRKNIIRFSVASSAVAAILIIALFPFKVEDASDLFEDHFEPFPNVYLTKGESETKSPLLEEAIQFYDAEAYDEAVLKFKKLNENELKSYVRLYYGISLLAVDDIETSKQTLNHLDANDPAYAEGQWYLGLAYLKQDSTNKAKQTLKNAMHLFGKTKQERIKKLTTKINKVK